MARKRITQIFPFLLPLRIWQRKKFFYIKMFFDKNKYAKEKKEELFENVIYETSSLMVNENSGYDIKYQYNKVHNLKLAANTVDKIIINPNETFSFWQLVRWADHKVKYKDGLLLVDGKIVGSYGGGLCQLSNMLFLMFLHTPMTIVERHGHAVANFAPASKDSLVGIDATINEGWLDLKVKNNTDNVFQIDISFDDKYIYGRILTKDPMNVKYSLHNDSVTYYKKNEKIYQVASVCRSETNIETKEENVKELYINECEVDYELSNDIEIEER